MKHIITKNINSTDNSNSNIQVSDVGLELWVSQ